MSTLITVDNVELRIIKHIYVRLVNHVVCDWRSVLAMDIPPGPVRKVRKTDSRNREQCMFDNLVHIHEITLK